MAEKWRNVIEGLLTKANAAGVTEAERDALIDKATYLMAKYGIEEAKARDKVTGEQVIYLDIKFSSHYRKQAKTLLAEIAIHLGGKPVFLDNSNAVRVFGYKGDLDRIKMLYASLHTQMLFGVMEASTKKPSYINGKSYNSSWMYGFVVEVGNRLHYMNKRIKTEEPDNLPVLRNRETEVDQAVDEAFPNLKYIKHDLTASSQNGFTDGFAAGRRADLGSSKLSRENRKGIGT
jgi:hypothetical protein